MRTTQPVIINYKIYHYDIILSTIYVIKYVFDTENHKKLCVTATQIIQNYMYVKNSK